MGITSLVRVSAMRNGWSCRPALQRVNIIAILRDDFLKVAMQIGPGARVGIFVDHKAGAGMANENRHRAGTKPLSRTARATSSVIS